MPELIKTTLTASSTLAALPQPRILNLARLFGVRLRAGGVNHKPKLAALLGAQLEGRLPTILRELGREELQLVCRAHGVPDSGTARRDLIERLLLAAGIDPKRSAPPPPSHHRDGPPQVPRFCPFTAEDQKSLETFQDQVIDHLFVLNAERAKEEARLGASSKKASKAKPTKAKKPKPPPDQGSLF